MSTSVILPQYIARKSALCVYLRELGPRLRRMAWFYARRLSLDGDDLLQEACQGLVEGWHKLDPAIGSPEQFLLCCARWRLLSYARKCRAHPMAPLEREIARSDPYLEAAATRLDIEMLSERLGPVQREVVRCLLAGMTWREAGDVIGCTSANVAYHVRKIRRALSDAAVCRDRDDEGPAPLKGGGK